LEVDVGDIGFFWIASVLLSVIGLALLIVHLVRKSKQSSLESGALLAGSATISGVSWLIVLAELLFFSLPTVEDIVMFVSPAALTTVFSILIWKSGLRSGFH
jgi:heme/copper-type cytochrome/quinol oxidase subunit 2